MDGELEFWIDDEPVGDYRTGHPDGTWLRATFHTDGCSFSACTEPEPFEGFNFRTSPEVGFKSVILDAYYERGSSANKREALEDRGLTVSDEQTIYYDDVVVATERIGTGIRSSRRRARTRGATDSARVAKLTKNSAGRPSTSAASAVNSRPTQIVCITGPASFKSRRRRMSSAIGPLAFRKGRWMVLATLIHELAHCNGAAGGNATVAEDALPHCGLGSMNELRTRVDDPQTPYDPGIEG